MVVCAGTAASVVLRERSRGKGKVEGWVTDPESQLGIMVLGIVA